MFRQDFMFRSIGFLILSHMCFVNLFLCVVLWISVFFCLFLLFMLILISMSLNRVPSFNFKNPDYLFLSHCHQVHQDFYISSLIETCSWIRHYQLKFRSPCIYSSHIKAHSVLFCESYMQTIKRCKRILRRLSIGHLTHYGV